MEPTSALSELAENGEHLQTYSGHNNAHQRQNNGRPFNGQQGRLSALVPQKAAQKGDHSHLLIHLEIVFNDQDMCNTMLTETV